MHVTIHTSQTWADTFISELNDTHVEAELRTKHIPPQVTCCLKAWPKLCFHVGNLEPDDRSVLNVCLAEAGHVALADQCLCFEQLDVEDVVKKYASAKQRLLVLGYNATLTTAVEAPRQPKRHFDQIKVLSSFLLYKTPTGYFSKQQHGFIDCSCPSTRHI